jgi:hypothetical protein
MHTVIDTMQYCGLTPFNLEHTRGCLITVIDTIISANKGNERRLTMKVNWMDGFSAEDVR